MELWFVGDDGNDRDCVSLLLGTHNADPGMQAGRLIGSYNYILTFVSGLDTIPYTVERLSSLNDITRRIELQTEDMQISEEVNPVIPTQIKFTTIRKLRI